MRLYKKIFFIFILFSYLLFCKKNVYAQKNEPEEYVQENFLRYDNHLYKPQIKCVQWQNYYRQNVLVPLLYLNLPQQALTLLFDELIQTTSAQTYPPPLAYTLIHCNAQWQPTPNFSPFEYLNGFTEANITNYQYSYNTTQPYISYSLQIPNNDISFKLSGNYILKIFENTKDKRLILTQKIMVAEPLLQVQSTLQTAGQRRYTDTHQTLNLQVQYKKLDTTNPLTDFKIALLQNGNWQNAQWINPTNLNIFDHTFEVWNEKQSIFDSGHEFRFWDTRNLTTLNDNTEKITQNNDSINFYHSYQKTDFLRIAHQNNELLHKNFKFSDLNGNFIIGTAFNKKTKWWRRTDPEYVYTHLQLKVNQPFTSGNVYVIGAFNQFQIADNYQLLYNPKSTCYEAVLFEKQGLYNYLYILVPDIKGAPIDFTAIESTKYSTENEYLVLIYYQSFAQRYDTLVGYYFF